ncbi:flavin reductase family protein [Aureimonas ureilytica]|uniref:flavin reductase family protein n=1 Tax=Aureimonas ureilytica TaxID=401562 RepID=UPI003CEA9417
MYHQPAQDYRPDRTATLKEALRRFTGAVCVVTSGEGDARTGATVTTAHSLSLDPPTMLVSVNRASSTFAAIERSGTFCVNLLSADRQDVAERFSGFTGHQGAARYEGADWLDLSTGAAALVDALAAIDCRVDKVVHYGSHALFFGAVETVLIGGERPSLLYGRGAYASSEPLPAL